MTQLTGKNDGLFIGETSAPAWNQIRFADVRELVKPRITKMVLITAFIGFVMAHRGLDGRTVGQVVTGELVTLLLMLLGTGLSCMGASALNQVLERDTDGLMPRTSNRPLPAGRMHPATACVIGLVLSVLGVSVLAVWTTTAAAFFSAATIASYVLIYTPMKRRSTHATIVGALPGALPPVIGAAAATGGVGTEAILLFVILFLWQLPHFLAIAWLYREDYAKASIPVLPAIEPEGRSTFRQILLGCMVLLPLGLLPTMLHVSGLIYFVGALLAGLGFLASAMVLTVRRTRKAARLAFFASLIYLPLVFGLMLIDQL